MTRPRFDAVVVVPAPFLACGHVGFSVATDDTAGRIPFTRRAMLVAACCGFDLFDLAAAAAQSHRLLAYEGHDIALPFAPDDDGPP